MLCNRRQIPKAIQLESVLEPRIARFGTQNLQQVVGIYFQMPSSSLLGGRVEVRLEYVDSQVQIAVSDTGKASVPIFCRICFRPSVKLIAQVQGCIRAGTGAGDRASLSGAARRHYQAESQGSGQGRRSR